MKRKALLLLGLFVLLMVMLPTLACSSSLMVSDRDLMDYVDGTPVAAECCWPFN